MLIVFDRATGDVLDNTGTSSVWPDGPPGEQAYVNTDRRGIGRDTVGLLRLDDDDDADLVQQVLDNRHHVDPSTGNVVIDGPYPADPPAPDPADEFDAALTDAAAKATVEEKVDALFAALKGTAGPGAQPRNPVR